MRAPVFLRPSKPLMIESVPDPEPGEGEVVVKVHRCGICGTDLHITEGHGYTVPEGTVLGHEYSGEVVAIGKGVERLKVGDRATALPVLSCGKCRECLNGAVGFCRHFNMLMGGYAEFALMGEDTAIKLPATLSLADAALAEPLAVALHGVAMANIKPGDRVLVQGAGPIGLSALFWAKRFGASRVDMIEGVAGRVRIAEAMGADSVRAPSGDLPLLPRNGDPEAPNVVIEAVGRAGVLSQSIALANRGATIVSLGNCFVGDTYVPAHASQKEVRMLFPQLYTIREFEHAVDVLDRGAVEPREMVTRTVGYAEVPQAFEGLRSSPADCKIMINPSLT